MITRSATFKIQPSYTEVSKPYAKLFKLIETGLHLVLMSDSNYKCYKCGHTVPTVDVKLNPQAQPENVIPLKHNSKITPNEECESTTVMYAIIVLRLQIAN